MSEKAQWAVEGHLYEYFQEGFRWIRISKKRGTREAAVRDMHDLVGRCKPDARLRVMMRKRWNT